MEWYKLVKVAEDFGHGDTLRGQYIKREKERLAKLVTKLRTAAGSGGPNDVLPRWKGEIRRKILMLPTMDVISRMSMYELSSLSEHVAELEGLMRKFSISRLSEIMGNGSNDRN